MTAPEATVMGMTAARSPIVRQAADVAAMTALATDRRDSGADPAGWASGPGWYSGVTAALEWAAGHRADPPMSHPAGPGAVCSHPASAGPPDRRAIARERGAAEEHLDGGYRHGDHSPGYADGVIAAIGWLLDQAAGPPAA